MNRELLTIRYADFNEHTGTCLIEDCKLVTLPKEDSMVSICYGSQLLRNEDFLRADQVIDIKTGRILKNRYGNISK